MKTCLEYIGLNIYKFLISQNISTDLQGPKEKYKLHYVRCTGLLFRAATQHNASCSDNKLNIKVSSLKSRENIQKKSMSQTVQFRIINSPASHHPPPAVDCSFQPLEAQGEELYSQFGCEYACWVQSCLNPDHLCRDREVIETKVASYRNRAHYRIQRIHVHIYRSARIRLYIIGNPDRDDRALDRAIIF